MELVINNSYSCIKGLKSPEFNKLRKILSYQIDEQVAYFSKNIFHTTKYLIDNKGNFPTGLITFVYDFLKDNNIKVKVTDLRKVPKSNPKTNKAKFLHKPYASQQKVADLINTRYVRGTISMPTGTGKSMVIALIAAKLQVKTLIVVPNLEIKKQLKESFSEIFENMNNIDIENIDSAALMNKNDYDCLIIDEAHHVAAKTYQTLNKLKWNNIYYRFFVTATPFRNKNEEALLFQAIAGDVIYRLSYQQAVNEGYIVPVDGYYIEIPRKDVDLNGWQQVYSKLVVNNDDRNAIIASLLLNLDEQGKSTLCLVKEVNHGLILSDLTGIPFANGKDESTREYIKQFNEGKIKVLIGTEGLLSEGVDTKPCEYVVIAALGKAKSSFMQKVGRGVRRYKDKDSAKIILFKDLSHKYTASHFKEQCKILKDEYNVIPLKLDIDI